MIRLVSLLLIPLFVLGHALPHSHAGTGVVEPDGHSIRAHIHLAGGHHHGHDHANDDHDHADSIHADNDHADNDHDHSVHDHCNGESSDSSESKTQAPASVSVPMDHDSDAIYLADVDGAVSRTVATPRFDSVAQSWEPLVWWISLDKCVRGRYADPPDRYAGLTIYLLTASLRL
ncbi:hypothetical protein [Rhodopirellula sallentina]|uniref:Secreted protein n=1 Tax=Rhodopirellula sallentina SM41 TaxID=1263870 RepID=M5U8A3_9BACT|nr:hypothetical protein [Rhodopirellula sallentina]EMI57509.1 secreted protein [Rhodopirellula sallentina SM41]